ncbi:MAG TPA: DUF2680 domain-containing protein [Bacillota bacterium]|nr:DUF2680 domain-containing protein [Bacillota bacterium]
MKNMRKLIIAGIVGLTLVAGTVTAFAASQYNTPAEAVAGLSGREVQSVIDERAQTGKTFGAIANEAGILDKFKAEMLKMKKNMVAERVADGSMTQEQADAIIARIEKNQANCDGTGTGCEGNGMGLGTGAGFGQNNDQGRGMGNGLRDGSCK